ncbi:DUF5988 family protein [Streptomyces cacaoi]|uniref:Uncharacterized protein n=1 Tax=Streptomyces cacaoi TaxID=1898 RepID=A0A4Y3QRD6_STRCI|nr:DUF5988 family protein [Streptomyces cacaoi]NNG85514.1 hypothetical protein [Streptomyces cacaoi]GEB47946.1 hypothetical protein SCA03_04970 [Streptomyces cacaoi]
MYLVRVLLEGGPSELPGKTRQQLRDSHNSEEHLRVDFRGGYEHFFFVAELGRDKDGIPLRRYDWSYRTEIAE